LATQDFYRVERLSTFANDICDMFTDGEMILLWLDQVWFNQTV